MIVGVLPQKWQTRYMHLALFVSQWSKDPSTKCGCVIVRPDKTIATIGYNGFPKEIEDDPELLNDRKKKYEHIVHAEDNALRNGREDDYIGYHLFVTPFMPCCVCAELIKESGVKYVYTYEASADKLERWKESFDQTKKMFEENGIQLIIL